jgi:hypothetical protein
MRRLCLCCVALLGGCVTPLPPVDPQQAWVDLRMLDGKVIMADRLDRQPWPDGRFFQLTPGAHELIVRFDFDIYGGGGGRFGFSSAERLCYLTLRYDAFKAGERYRVEARSLGLQPMARLYDSQERLLAEDSDVNCLL